jgi:hypothetical protein
MCRVSYCRVQATAEPQSPPEGSAATIEIAMGPVNVKPGSHGQAAVSSGGRPEARYRTANGAIRGPPRLRPAGGVPGNAPGCQEDPRCAGQAGAWLPLVRTRAVLRSALPTSRYRSRRAPEQVERASGSRAPLIPDVRVPQQRFGARPGTRAAPHGLTACCIAPCAVRIAFRDTLLELYVRLDQNRMYRNIVMTVLRLMCCLVRARDAP